MTGPRASDIATQEPVRGKSLQERIRSAIAKKRGLKACAACGRLDHGGLRALTKETGVSTPTLSRFLRGAEASGKVLDKLDAWLAK